MDEHVIAQIADRARYLSERVRDTPCAPDEQVRVPARWKREAFHDGESFDRYLQAHGTTEEQVAHALEHRDALGEELPAWAQELRRAVDQAPDEEARAHDTAVLFGTPHTPAPFGSLSARFSGPAVEHLRTASHGELVPGSSLEQDLRSALTTRLLNLSLRSLITALHRAREHGELRGDSPESRYLDFDRRLLQDPGTLSRFFLEHPVLGRLLGEGALTWRTGMADLFAALAADRSELAARGWIASPGTPLVALKADAGDTHEGHSVAICTFACGGRVVYKPRDAGMDVLYERATRYLNRRAGRHVVRAPGVLDRSGHAWVEFVEQRACEPGRRARHYTNLGATLALTHALGAGDIHMENAVAAGDDSVVVDLETLLQNRDLSSEGDTAFARARDTLNRGVLGVGFLPMRTGHGQSAQTADVSVISGGRDRAEITLPALTGVGTDRLAIGRATAVMRPAANLPGAPEEIDPAAHTEDIVAGFEEAHLLIAQDHEGFLAALGDLSRLSTSHLLRPTRLYGKLLHESTHPAYLRDGVDREHLFDRLWSTTTGQASVRSGTASEVRQLLSHDVPHFTASVTGLSLSDGAGEVDASYFSSSAASALQDRLSRTGGSELAQHVSTIREAMASLTAQSADEDTGTSRRPIRPGRAPSAPERLRERAAEAARRVLDDLDRSRIDGSSGQDSTWIGTSPSSFDGNGFEYRPLSPLMFEGLSGLTLAHVGAARAFGAREEPDPDLLRTARKCARPVAAFVEDVQAGTAPPADSVGAFSGYTGALFALLHLSAALGGDDRIDRLLLESAESVRMLSEQDTYHDLAAGASGAAVVCLRIHEHTGDEHALRVAVQVARSLADRARSENGRLSWPTDIDGGHLGGFAHGASGIGWALVETGAAAKDTALVEAGRRAFAFDTAHFDPEAGGWPDLRREVRGRRHFPVQWCHGAVGVGLSRLLAHRSAPAPALAEEAATALETTLARGVPPNDSLCHGTLGAREFLAGMAERSMRAREALHDLDRTILDRFERGLATDGIVGSHTTTPGLMLGQAGFVLGLLRIAEPSRVPSPLSLEGPRIR